MSKDDKRKSLMAGIAAFLASMVTAPNATGQEADAAERSKPAIEEIIVTAQKRDQSLQDVSTAVTAFTADEIQTINFSETASLAEFVPNLTMTNTANLSIFVRGIGQQGVSPVAAQKIGVYQDQVYQGLRAGQNFQFFDLERIEVLKGPQGTLYGKNTTGGALNITSRQPDGTHNGYLQIDAGNYDSLSIEGAAGFPLAERWSARVAGVVNRRDGWATNIVDGRKVDTIDDYGIRAMLRYEGERLDALLRLTRGRQRSDFYAGQARTDLSPFGGATIGGYINPFSDKSHVAYDQQGSIHYVDQDGIALIWDYDVGPFTLTSVTSYDEVKANVLADTDATPQSLVVLGSDANSHQFVQELRIANDASARLDYLVGFFFADETLVNGGFNVGSFFADALPVFGLDATEITTGQTQSKQQYALFADFNYALTEQWSVIGGLRYTIDDAKFSTVAELMSLNGVPPSSPTFTVPFTTFDKQWEELTGHMGIEWRPTEEMLLYANVSRSFNGGGFNGQAQFDPGEAVSVEPEFLNAFEVGVKTTGFDRRLTANLSGFYYDFKDMQEQITTTSPFSNNFISIVENAATAELYGMELEVVALPSDYLRVSAGLGLLHAEYDEFQSIVADFSGNRMQDAPKVDFSGVVHYQRPFAFGEWLLRGEFNYTTETFANPSQQPYVSSGDNEIINLRAGWLPPDERWKVTFWVRNLTDNQYVDHAFDLIDGFGELIYLYHEPRTYGAQVIFYF